MRILRKTSAIIISAVILMSLFVITASAKSSWSFDKSTGTLTISDDTVMKDYYVEYDDDSETYDRPWSKYNSAIKSIVIEKGVKYIGSCAFYECRNAETVTIPETVTEMRMFCFDGCDKLKGVYIENTDKWSEIQFDDESANPLYNAHNLYLNNKLVTEFNFPEGTKEVNAFVLYGAKCIEKVTLPKGVNHIYENAFTGTSFIDKAEYENGALYIDSYLIDVKDNTEGKLVIKDGTTLIASRACDGCKKLTSVEIPASLKIAGYGAFDACDSLKDVYITDLKAWCDIDFIGDVLYNIPNPLRYAGNLYLNGELVENLVIPEGVTKIKKSAFYACGSIKTVTIPEGVKNINEFAFDDCDNLKSINFPASLSELDYAFENTPLQKVNIKDIAAWCKIKRSGGEFNTGANFYLNNVLITDLVIPSGVKSISKWAFHNFGCIKNVKISNGVETIGSHAFSSCENLKKVEISSSVTTIGSYAFYNCESLASVSMPSGVKEIGKCAFWDCESLKSIKIPKSVKKIGSYAFDDCESLTSVNISSGLKEIEKGVFWDCKSLKSIKIPKSVTTIGSNAFVNCKSLKSIKIPSSVTTIGSSAFEDCISLKSIKIPKSVKKIGAYAFAYCKKLTVTVPKTVKRIGRYAFSDIKKLIVKKRNSPTKVKLTKKTITVSAKTLNKDRTYIKFFTYSNSVFDLKAKILKKGTSSAIRKKIGVLIWDDCEMKFKQGKYKKGTYKVKIKFYEEGDEVYKPFSKTMTVKIRIK